MLLTGAEVVSVAALGWALLAVSITLVLGGSRRDASLYPFIAGAVCFISFVDSIPQWSYLSSALFIVNLLLGVFLYRDE